MNLKFLAKIIEFIIGKQTNDDRPRPDMYFPEKLLAFGVAGILASLVSGAVYIFQREIMLLVMTVIFLPIGILAIICWRNQSITITSDNTFEYKTFLGNIHEYHFSDITDLKINSDSYTLFIGKNKVHIEAMAILSDRLSRKIDDALDRIYGEERYYPD